jgi:predicted nuclease of predicted toxin-antitoxin system
VKIYIDQQLPPLLAQWLRDRSYDAQHVRDIDLTNSSDHAIWKGAILDDAVIVSRDSDFALFARQDPQGRLVWLRWGNCSNPELVAAFEQVWPAIAKRLEAGERFIEVSE